jgi:DNA-binding MarR family transcriptional regulator
VNGELPPQSLQPYSYTPYYPYTQPQSTPQQEPPQPIIEEEEKEADEITFTFLTKRLKHHLRNNYDALVVISGGKGEGKTTLAHWFGKYIDERYTIERNFIFAPTYNAIRDKILGLEKYSVPIVDEAIKSFFKQDWFTEVQKSLLKLFTITRKENKLTILCIPDFTELRSDLRQKLVNLWIHIPERGKAIVFVPSPNPELEDRWLFKKNIKIWEKATDRLKTIEIAGDVDRQLTILRKFRGYMTDFEFPEMPKEEEAIYSALYEKNKYEITEEKESMSLRAKQYRQVVLKAVWALNYRIAPQWSQKKIAEELGLDAATISVMVNEMKKTVEKERDRNELVGTPATE